MTNSDFIFIPLTSVSRSRREAIGKQIFTALFEVDEDEHLLNRSSAYPNWSYHEGIHFKLLLLGKGFFCGIEGVQLKILDHRCKYVCRSVKAKTGQLDMSKLKQKLAELKELQVIENEKRAKLFWGRFDQLK